MGRNTALPAGYERFRVGRPEQAEDTGCHVLHVDMDAFFAAVELRTRPELAERPVIVAGAGPRSVVLSANYPARRFGVSSAMPTTRARRLCPQAVYLPPTRGLYSEVSRGVMALFNEITPLVEPLSLDEAFLDVSGALRRLGSTPAEIGARLREQVAAQHGVSCSVGVAGVKFVAKLASGMAKPDGMVVVPVDETVPFLRPLPVSALWGVGPKTAEALRARGLRTIADLAEAPLDRLCRMLGVSLAEHLHALAHGRDERAVEPVAEEKSLGAERTFDTDLTDRRVHERHLLELAERVAASLRSRELRGRTVSIKVRFSDFRTITRARTLRAPTDVAREIHTTAVALLAEEGSIPPVRLLGVRAEGLSGAARAEQLTFDDVGGPSRWRDAEVAADIARSKFGAGAVRPASLLADDGE